MADKEEDYSSLPLDERLVHRVWKVRVGAYDELTKQFESSRNEHDPCFDLQPELLKGSLLDANVAAQESAYNAFVHYLKYGGTPQVVHRLKNVGIVGAICEKGLTSTRKNTKEYVIESMLLLVEISKDPNAIIEDIIPFLGHRLPKLVAGCVGALGTLVENFGCKIISPKNIIPSLGKLYGHADKNVRAETKRLTIELYKWMGDSLPTILFPDLKPVQQKELTTAFEGVKGTVPEQKRLTKVQQEALELEKMQNNNNNDQDANEDIEMADASNEAEENFDPLEFFEPVEILDKLPDEFNARISSAKWKDRKEVLEETVPILEKAPKLVTNDDYSVILRILAKCMKDANVQVVELAANCIEMIAKGLGQGFHKYQSYVLTPVIERTKEKKPSVAAALDGVLDAIFNISGLSAVLDEAIAGMKLKTPQNKIAAANYVKRCLAATKVPPKSTEIDAIMEVGTKLLGESQEPIRQAATEMIGTLMKITGPRELNTFLESVQEARKTKIVLYSNTVEVKCKAGSRASSSTPAAPKRANPAVSAAAPASLRNPPAPKKSIIQPTANSALKPSSRMSFSSIPAKRGASSPVKREDGKSSGYGRGLTSLSLAKTVPGSSHVNPPYLGPSETQTTTSITTTTRGQDEINSLRAEIKKYQMQREKDQQNLQELRELSAGFQQENESLKSRLENYERESMISLRHKDTQLNQLRVEFNKMRERVAQLEQENENLKAKNSVNRSPFRPVESPMRVSSNELSSGVKRLSIDPQPSNGLSGIPLSRSSNNLLRSDINRTDPVEFDISSDWKKASEVTDQLRARIQKMKARTRNSSVNV